ncbi:hypothetical protein FRC03_008226, partial [Tulasnella sp. 419]
MEGLQSQGVSAAATAVPTPAFRTLTNTPVISTNHLPSPTPGPASPTISVPSQGWLTKLKPFAGIINDIKCRLPFYLSDWTDAYNYRVIPSTALIFFA